jgi:glycosyltransferase involved in cell wall biosynthesis
MINVGVWLPLPKGSHWQGEGIARTVEFIVKGMNDEGILEDDISVSIFTNHWMEDSITRSFDELLGVDARKVKFCYLTESSLPKFLTGTVDALADAFLLKPVLIDEKRDVFQKDISKSRFLRYQHSAQSVEFGRPIVWDSIVRKPSSKFFLGRWLLKRRLEAFEKKYGIKHRELVRNRLEIVSGRNKDTVSKKFYSLSNRELFLYLVESGVKKVPFLGKRLVNRFVSRAEERSFLNRLWSHSHAATTPPPEKVDVWWVPTPIVRGAELLAKPKLINFFDFFVGDYGYYWGEAQVKEIYFRLNLILSRADKIITQSRNNKYNKIIRPFNVDPERVAVCHVAAPDHYPKYLKSFSENQIKKPETLREAAEIVRREMHWRSISTGRHKEYARVGTQYDKLADFDFENKKFILISTQNRPYKNLKFLIDILPKITRQFEDEVYFFFTAAFDFQDSEDSIVKKLMKARLTHRVFSIPRLPNKVHAAIYHCATLTVHPSLAEGGAGSYPFMEGMMMGTPGLTASGEHTEEGKLLHPDYDRVVYTSNARLEAVEKILKILRDPEAAYKYQKPIFDAHRAWTWRKAAMVYRDALYRTHDGSAKTLKLTHGDEFAPEFEGFGDFGKSQ